MNPDRRLLQLVKQYPLPFVASVLLATLGGIMLIGQTFLLSSIIDALFLKRAALDNILNLLLLLMAWQVCCGQDSTGQAATRLIGEH